MTERFTLLSELGRGGMGVVWKARDEETGQIVALKLLREAYAEDPEYLARFERELELARRIDSIHVVKVLGFGVREKVPYLALEYVDGPSLHAALVANGPYSWPETRALLIQLTQGLADANAAGVIHRDVKPSNVLMGPDGVAKLTDFGIARGLDLTRMTATSTLLGTPAYMAPEGPKDARSDLYSLGIIGYELLTGAVPFKGTSYQEVVVDHIRTPPDLAKLPPEARDVVGWLLEKDPAARPQRASALLPVLYGAAEVPTLANVLSGVAVRGQVHPRPMAQARVATQRGWSGPAAEVSAKAPSAAPVAADRASASSYSLRNREGSIVSTSERRSLEIGLVRESGSTWRQAGAWLLTAGAAASLIAFALPWLDISSSNGPSTMYGSDFAGGLGARFGSAGSIANSVYVLLSAIVVGWLAWPLVAGAGRLRVTRLALASLAAASGVVIVIVTVAAMQTVTGMMVADESAGITATIGTGVGLILALCGGVAILTGALVVTALEIGLVRESGALHD